MIYAFIENGFVKEYPVFQGQIKERFPNVSFPVPFSPPDGYVEVKPSDAPAFDYTKKTTEALPVFIDGNWVQQWKVEDADQATIDLIIENTGGAIRADRNAKLSACDWTQLADAPVDSSAWASYRQELRDVPSQSGFPFNIDWPQPPA